mmetsp:Transcript_17149/g.27407  ORF Transcript_17149/g.27407 Transcript_17149/m.27407 type:complete len:108 (-) Transcript_17149:156-479(-)
MCTHSPMHGEGSQSKRGYVSSRGRCEVLTFREGSASKAHYCFLVWRLKRRPRMGVQTVYADQLGGEPYLRSVWCWPPIRRSLLHFVMVIGMRQKNMNRKGKSALPSF